jgi:prephenate dehydratase
MSGKSLGKAAFQGAPGAFSHEACALYAPGYEPVAFPWFDEAFAAVASGACDIGVLPIHNVTAGPVEDVARLLPLSGLRTLARHDMIIRQNLMALPGVTLGEITEVRTHPMALGQCRLFLGKHGLKAVEALDTAGAARDLAQSGERTVAVIAAREAARLYGLSVLAPDIQDDPTNYTTFVVVGR